MPIDLGERFARSMGAKDVDAVRGLLAPKVNFRGLTPGRYWERDDANAVVDEVILGTWFSPERPITQILGVESATIGDVGRVGYVLGKASRRRLRRREADVLQVRARQDLLSADSGFGVCP